MIGTISIKCNAAHPELALPAVYAYVDSPSSIRILDVPKKIGKWQITSVSITFVYPDGEIVSAPCVLTGGVWVGTLDGNPTSGTSENGVTIFASGVDENGVEVHDYILGKGDLNILDADGGLHPVPSMQYVKLLSAEAAQPKTGDLFPVGGDYYIYQNGQPNPIGITHSELNSVQIIASDALNIANVADNKAGLAINKATSADSNAEYALDKANYAVDKANTAVATANAAQSTANNASDKAQDANATAAAADSKAEYALVNAANAQTTADQALNALSGYATIQYVDDIVGDINTILEGLN